jgi:hypothetical protein
MHLIQLSKGEFVRATRSIWVFQLMQRLVLSVIWLKRHLPDSHSWNIRILFKLGSTVCSKAKIYFPVRSHSGLAFMAMPG